MSTETTIEEIPFATQLAKEFVISAAVTAGVVVGFMAVGAAYTKIVKMKDARNIKRYNKQNEK